MIISVKCATDSSTQPRYCSGRIFAAWVLDAKIVRIPRVLGMFDLAAFETKQNINTGSLLVQAVEFGGFGGHVWRFYA